MTTSDTAPLAPPGFQRDSLAVGAVAFMLVALLCLSACSGGDADSTSTDGEASITLVSPEDGATVCGSPLVVVTDVENFNLTNETIEDPPPDTGHMHVYLNGQEVAQSDQETVEVADVADLEYQLTVDLARADHQALDPYAGQTIYITVDHTTCTE